LLTSSGELPRAAFDPGAALAVFWAGVGEPVGADRDVKLAALSSGHERLGVAVKIEYE
jgi:hypothetical protein